MYYLAGWFLIVSGVIMLLFAEQLLKYGYRWRIRGNPTPTRLAVWSTRIGGIICTVIGVAAVIYAICVPFWEEVPSTPPPELGKGEISCGTTKINYD